MRKQEANAFYDQHLPPTRLIPNKVYLFDGRKYLCQKIEITLDDQGVQPLKKGYFYEIG